MAKSSITKKQEFQSVGEQAERVKKAEEHILAAAALLKDASPALSRVGWMLEDLLEHLTLAIEPETTEEYSSDPSSIFTADFSNGSSSSIRLLNNLEDLIKLG